MNPFAFPLPAAIRSRAAIIGIICGAFCFPIALFGARLRFLLPGGPPGVVLTIILTTVLAGVLACLLMDTEAAYDVPGAALRVGVRGELFAAFVGSAATVFASTLHAFGFSRSIFLENDVLGLKWLGTGLSSVLVFLTAVLAIPPAAFFGFFGTLVTAIARSRVALSGPPPNPAPRKPWDLFFIITFMACVVCFLSPLSILILPSQSFSSTQVPVQTTPAPLVSTKPGMPNGASPGHSNNPLAVSGQNQSTPRIIGDAGDVQDVQVPADVAQRLTAMLTMHHGMVTAGNIDALVRDYDDKVDYRNFGTVDREFIRKDQTQMHAAGAFLAEELSSPPVFLLLADNTYSATYTVAFHRSLLAGGSQSGTKDMEMHFRIDPRGTHIVWQRERIVDSQKEP